MAPNCVDCSAHPPIRLGGPEFAFVVVRLKFNGARRGQLKDWSLDKRLDKSALDGSLA